MIQDFSLFLGLVVLIIFLIMLSNRIKVAYPILLLLAGLGVSFIPSIPNVKIDPNLIFIIFLPPLLYEAAWANSWKEIWRWRKIIGSYAFIIVFLTAISVAFVVNYFIPGFSLALGFLLGGIVSPPDAVSAGAILKFVKIPKRMATLLEGESLFNDASSLIILRFALTAVATGQFILQDAAVSFAWMIFGGTGIGLIIALLFKKIHQWFPTETDSNIDVILSLIAPFIMYIAAEEVHASGVMSVVCGGLYLSYHNYHIINSSSRLRGTNVWHSFTFILNGLVFLLIGLGLPDIIEGLKTDGIGLYQATIYGLLVTAVLIIVRILASYGAVLVTQIMSKFITVADTRVELKSPFIIGWAGMRGVVSLAAALSIPLTLEDGTPFPHRSLILYITFVAIFVTLVFQGLTLPFIIKKMNLPEFDDHLPEEQTEHFILKELAKNSIDYLNNHYKTEIENSNLLRSLIQQWENRLKTEEEMKIPEHIRKIYLDVLCQKREFLFKLNNENPKINEEIIRKFIHRIDLEEERINHE